MGIGLAEIIKKYDFINKEHSFLGDIKNIALTYSTQLRYYIDKDSSFLKITDAESGEEVFSINVHRDKEYNGMPVEVKKAEFIGRINSALSKYKHKLDYLGRFRQGHREISQIDRDILKTL